VNRHVSLLLFLVIVVGTTMAGGWLRLNFAQEWWPQPAAHGLRPFPVEADCYSQLARVQRILDGGKLIQNHFTVENWPKGLIPSTTAPFDYIILALRAPLTFFTAYPLDWAGALVSPVLWIALLLFWIFFRSRAFNRAGRAALVAGVALVPVLIWATAFGRPRHQSLILGLLAVLFTAEYERWEKGAARGWHIAAGVLWGLICWTSLYEPLFVVVCLVAFNLIVRRRETPAFGISFGVVMLLALLVEGVHVFIPPPEAHFVLTNWLQFIAEMQGMTPYEFFNAITFSGAPEMSWWGTGSFLFLLALPWIAFCLWKKKDPTDRFLMGLAIVLALFALYQRRWLPYASLAEVFLVARFFQMAPLQWMRVALAVVFFADAALAGLIFIAVSRMQPPNQPSAELARLAGSIDEPGGILAPWWLSPGLLYFSGQPIVSGSSHCGISGIAASAEFYATTSWVAADTILQQRQVRWVVVWDEPKYQYPLLASSQEILGQPVSTDKDPGDATSTIVQILIDDRDLPDNIRLRAVTQHLKLYEVVDSGGGS
jgi:asparagine N-glycosylation enzyme membrane subunit Stt3